MAADFYEKANWDKLRRWKHEQIFWWAQQRIDRWNRLFQFLNLRTKIWWASIRFRGFCDYSTRQDDSTNFWSNKGIKDVINRKVRGSTRDCFDKYSRCSWMAHTESVDGATKDGNTCSKGFQDRSLNGKCMLVDSATCCACNQGMENWYAKCRRKQ